MLSSGKTMEYRAILLGRGSEVHQLRHIAVQVADSSIDLPERNAQESAIAKR